jgi:hypothetical protein
MLVTSQIFQTSATALAAALFLGCVCAGGQDVPPTPGPKDEGPSLADTMKFIEDKLNSIGSVNYIGYAHDNLIGNEWANKFGAQATNVRADVAACQIDFHWRVTRDDQVVQELDAWFSLRAVDEVTVKTREQNLKELNAKAGHPEWTTRVDPPAFVVAVALRNGESSFILYDESSANRIAKAIVRAVELCGGGDEAPQDRKVQSQQALDQARSVVPESISPAAAGASPAPAQAELFVAKTTEEKKGTDFEKTKQDETQGAFTDLHRLTSSVVIYNGKDHMQEQTLARTFAACTLEVDSELVLPDRHSFVSGYSGYDVHRNITLPVGDLDMSSIKVVKGGMISNEKYDHTIWALNIETTGRIRTITIAEVNAHKDFALHGFGPQVSKRDESNATFWGVRTFVFDTEDSAARAAEDLRKLIESCHPK